MSAGNSAVIPLRGGSKGIPDKNIIPVAGKPLCRWVIEAAEASGVFDRIWVSTDSEAIKQTVEGFGIRSVAVLDRPEELAADTATTESVILQVLSQVSGDCVVTIQATSPLTEAEDFRRAMEQFEARQLDSMLTGVRDHSFFWTDEAEPVNYNPLNRPRRQEFSGLLRENGAFYFTRRAIWENYECRLGGAIGMYEMQQHQAPEIDTPEDLQHCEQLLLRHKVRRELAQNPVKLVAVDVDGTLTDGGMYYGSGGEELKKFHTRDGKGLELLRRRGVTTAVITGEDSPIARSRAEKLGVDYIYTGIQDKLPVLESIAKQEGIGLDQIAYIGDDVNDLECARAAGFPGCPSDARPEIQRQCAYICHNRGGEGAVREFCEVLLEQLRETSE